MADHYGMGHQAGHWTADRLVQVAECPCYQMYNVDHRLYRNYKRLLQRLMTRQIPRLLSATGHALQQTSQGLELPL